MLPESGTGAIQISPIYPQTRSPIPLQLCPSIDEANSKYQLANALNTAGECYCEVSLNGHKQIDLVWIDHEGSTDSSRIVGIEIKTASEFNQATHKLESQVDEYHSVTVADLTNATAVAGDSIMRADETYVFDEVWVVAVGGQDRWDLPWRDDTPEDGWLNYNPVTGRLTYEIDATPDRDTIPFDFEQRATEAQYTAFLWDWYQSSSEALVAAESWFSKPRDRLLKGGGLKYRKGKGEAGKTKQADLVVSKNSEIDPLREDSTIRGVEVKSSFDANTRNRLNDQLPLYRDSGLFSEVYLAVQDDDRQAATSFLETNYPQVGLLTMDLVNQEVSLIRQSKPLELKKIPVGRCPGSDIEFQL